MEKGALEVDANGRFRAVSEKFPAAIRDLLHDMLMLQAAGDYEGTKQFLDKYGKPTRAADAIERSGTCRWISGRCMRRRGRSRAGVRA